MGSFTETLRLLVDMDAKGAISQSDKLGESSKKATEKAEKTGKSLDKWGNKMSSAGTGMIAFGAVALAGLGAAAMASEEAELSVLKLENTIKNAPKLAGESSKQFIELAESIQSVTAADADAIVEGEALLGTFSLTADEIKGIMPLVVDYARKFGTDIPTAAIQVGKALDGSVGALKKNGVSIDEVLYKTDRYAAVQQALTDQVGGFAEAEGKTFAGSLQRLKNQIGDLVEGVGAGAVDAFTTLARVTGGLSDRLNGMSPTTQSMIGKVATFGAVGLIAAGGLSTLVGQGIKAHENFRSLADGASSLSQKLGGIGKIAAFTTVAAGIAGVAFALNEIADARDAAELERLADNFLLVGDAVNATTKKAVEQADEFGQLDKVIAKLSESNPRAAEETIKLAEATGVSKERVKEWRAELERKRDVDIKASVSQEEYSEDVRDGAEAMDENAESTEDAKSALQEWSDAQRAAIDPMFAFNHAVVANEEAQSKVVEAELKIVAAEADVAKARKEHGRNSDEAREAVLKLAEAQGDLEGANRSAVESALEYDTAFAGLKDSMLTGGTTVGEVKATIDRWAESGLIAAGSAAFYKAEVDKLANAIRQTPDRKATSVTAPNAVQAREQIDRVGSALARLNGKSASVRIKTVYETVQIGSAHGPGFKLHDGGIVPGRRGEEIAAVLQAGEEVLALDDPRNSSNAKQLVGAGVSSGGATHNHYWTINVAGSVLSERDLMGVLRDNIQRGGLRGLI